MVVSHVAAAGAQQVTTGEAIRTQLGNNSHACESLVHTCPHRALMIQKSTHDPKAKTKSLEFTNGSSLQHSQQAFKPSILTITSQGAQPSRSQGRVINNSGVAQGTVN